MTPAPDSPASKASAIEKIRNRFPGTSLRAHLDVASRSLIPASAQEIAASHLAERINGVIDKDRYFGLVEHARRSFAMMINASSAEVAITKNVSEGLNIVATSINWDCGDEVFLCSDIEHPNNVYTWRNLEHRGVVVRDFPARAGLFPIDDVIDALQKSSRARVVTVSATSFKPGFRTDLDALSKACRAVGAYLVVDGAQSAGITHTDVERTGIDALAVSTQKGLCSLYGMGFLYVRKEFAETLIPSQLARFGVTIDATHEADYDPGPIHYRPGALRFDVGNYNFLAAALVGSSLDMLLSVGTEAIDQHVTALASSLAHQLIAAGLPVIWPEGALSANMVCIDMAKDPLAAASLQRYLQENQVQAAVRRNLLRFSIHVYNNESDIDAAAAVTKRWADQRRASTT